MSTPAPTQSLGQQLLSLLENDALLSFGTPILAFLQSVAVAAGDPIKLTAAVIKLQSDIVTTAPTALGGLEAQLATLLATKLQAKLAAAKPA